jgi:hypothetical protein
MRTIDQGTSGQSTLCTRVLERVRLVRRLAWMTLDYFVVGGRVRRAYRERILRGETLYLDRWPRLPDDRADDS